MIARRSLSRLALILTVLLLVSHAGMAFASPYEVKPGDTLWLIGQRFGVTVDQLHAANAGLTGTMIYPGQVLNIPGTPTAPLKPVIKVSEGEFELLARMISAEANQQPYLGMVAVGAVIVNRVKSPNFPNTITGVLYQPGQFQPISNGWFWKTPVTATHRQAARDALNGLDPTNGALFFFVYARVTNAWLWSRPYRTTIGAHRFVA